MVQEIRGTFPFSSMQPLAGRTQRHWEEPEQHSALELQVSTSISIYTSIYTPV